MFYVEARFGTLAWKMLTAKKGLVEYMGVSLNGGFPPKSSILIGVSMINHPFWGTTILGNPHICVDIPFFLEMDATA